MRQRIRKTQKSVKNRMLHLLIYLLMVLRMVSSLFIILIHKENPWAAALVMGFAIFTDVADGMLTRIKGFQYNGNPYFDPYADFTLVIVLTFYFVSLGHLNVTTLVIILFMFAQFIMSSRIERPIYDRLGKYYGFACFLLCGAAIFYEMMPIMVRTMELGLIIYTAAVIYSRHMIALKIENYSG